MSKIYFCHHCRRRITEGCIDYWGTSEGMKPAHITCEIDKLNAQAKARGLHRSDRVRVKRFEASRE